jgi:hypothetical protein
MKAFLQHLRDVLVVVFLILALLFVFATLDPEGLLLRIPH